MSASPALLSVPSPSSPSPTASHSSPAFNTPRAAPEPTRAPSQHTRQLYLAVPGPAEGEDDSQSLAQLPPAAHLPHSADLAQAIVRPAQGVREPSYGGLGSADRARRVDEALDWLRRRASGGGADTERLAKRPRTRERRSTEWNNSTVKKLEKRQNPYPYAEGYPSCSNVGNDVLSCYPETNSTLVQGDYSKFIWNSRYPTFIGAGYVDVYLYNADTDELAQSYLNQTNAEGMVSIFPADQWWASPTQSTDEWFGDAAQNRTTPYYFVVVDGGSELTGGEEHQATFDVIQTAAPTSLSSSLASLTSSSLSSASSAASASSLSSASSASLASASSLSSLVAAGLTTLPSTSSTSTSSSRGSSGRSGDLQNNSSSGTSIPKWAIALIVILGFLALVGGGLAVYFCLGRARKRRAADEQREKEEAQEYDDQDDDVTNGSRDPILGSGGGLGRGSTVGGSSVAGGAAGAGGLAGLAAGGVGGAAAAAGLRDVEKQEEEGTISHTDAARMAEAFRAALRKQPEFEDVPSTDDSPTSLVGGDALAAAGASRPGASPMGREEGSGSGQSGEGNEAGRVLVEDELRSEGKSMKSVEGGGKRWGRQQASV
ncbi:hypothetical protein JCM8547_007123 [Rhodosporidiobolus lusitaniae]